MFDIFGVGFDVVSARFDFIPHEEGKGITRFVEVVDGHLEQSTIFRSHGGLPELLGVHFTQTFVALDVRTLFGTRFDFIEKEKQIFVGKFIGDVLLDLVVDVDRFIVVGIGEEDLIDDQFFKPIVGLDEEVDFFIR